MEIRDRYLEYIPVYTDGSRDNNYVACATVFPSHTVISIFTAEIWAVINKLNIHLYSNILFLQINCCVSILYSI